MISKDELRSALHDERKIDIQILLASVIRAASYAAERTGRAGGRLRTLATPCKKNIRPYMTS